MNSDFDFLHGTWDIDNRRLLKPLSGGDEWEEFPSVAVCQGFFDGAGVFDEITFPTKGFKGASIRTFDVERELWAIYWINSETGILHNPVFGTFADGKGVFHGDETHEGTPVRMRYTWSEITPTTALWEQAFSADGEKTWETNWTMRHTRRA